MARGSFVILGGIRYEAFMGQTSYGYIIHKPNKIPNKNPNKTLDFR